MAGDSSGDHGAETYVKIEGRLAHIPFKEQTDGEYTSIKDQTHAQASSEGQKYEANTQLVEASTSQTLSDLSSSAALMNLPQGMELKCAPK